MRWAVSATDILCHHSHSVLENEVNLNPRLKRMNFSDKYTSIKHGKSTGMGHISVHHMPHQRLWIPIRKRDRRRRHTICPDEQGTTHI